MALFLETSDMADGCSRLFVYGVEKDLPEKSIKPVAEKFGAVKDVKNSHKGFGFISFEAYRH